MSDAEEPTLADDEASLARYATVLADAVEAVVHGWLRGLIDRHVPGASADEPARSSLDEAAAATIRELRQLLARDIAEQPVGPLEVLRRAVIVPNELLVEAGATPATRDEFSQRAFPQDRFGLTPASFADVDPSLHEPGLMWGAAKAHVHLRRRRESS